MGGAGRTEVGGGACVSITQHTAGAQPVPLPLRVEGTQGLPKQSRQPEQSGEQDPEGVEPARHTVGAQHVAIPSPRSGREGRRGGGEGRKESRTRA